MQHGPEARPFGHRIGAAYSRIVELGLDLITMRLGEASDHCAASGPLPKLDIGGVSPRTLKLHRKTKGCLKLSPPGTTAAEEGGEPP